MAHLGKSALVLLRRIRAAAHRGRLDDDLQEEMRQHLALRRQQLMDAGMAPQDAHAAALRSFGNATHFREEARDLWSFPWMDAAVQDLRYGLRLLRRAPAFTAFTVCSLGTAIGGAAAVFNVVDAVLLRTLAVRSPHEIREFSGRLKMGAAEKQIGGVSDAARRDLQRSVDFADLVGIQPIELSAGDTGSAPRTLRAELVSDNYFQVLGVPPETGRLLAFGDDDATPIPVVLSERFWHTAFDGDPAIAGRHITLNAVPATIVGVARGFLGVMADHPADVFAPLGAAPRLEPALTGGSSRMLLRLRPEVSQEIAAQRLAALYTAGPSMIRGAEFTVGLASAAGGISDARSTLTRPLWMGFVLAGLLLLVACANTGGLLVARFAARQGEFGVRIAIGAGRGRLIRQLVVEALLVAALAGTAGLLIAWTLGPLLLQSIPFRGTAPDFDLRLDWRLVSFTFAVSLAAALAVAGASLFRLIRSDRTDLLRAHSRFVSGGGRRAARLLIAGQVACSLLLLVGAGSMARTLTNLHRVDPGFDPANTFTVRVDATDRTAKPDVLHAYHRDLLERLASAPAVRHASVAQVGLMTGSATSGTVNIAGWTASQDEDRWSRMFFVGPHFLEATGMRVVRGRGLESADMTGRERVAVVSEELARFYFGGSDAAIDRVVNRDVRIVGVVGDARYDTLRDAPSRAMFIPYTQAPPRQSMTYFVRTTGDRALAIESTLSAIRAYDATLKVRVIPLSDQVVSTLSRERFVAGLAVVVALLALLLSCTGLYASVAYSVSERRGELAVRLALGASARDIHTSVLREPLRTTIAGVLIGIPAAVFSMRGVSALLFGVSPMDPTLLLGCGAGLVLIAAAAALRPARRASRIDPVRVLRNESWA